MAVFGDWEFLREPVCPYEKNTVVQVWMAYQTKAEAESSIERDADVFSWDLDESYNSRIIASRPVLEELWQDEFGKFEYNSRYLEWVTAGSASVTHIRRIPYFIKNGIRVLDPDRPIETLTHEKWREKFR